MNGVSPVLSLYSCIKYKILSLWIKYKKVYSCIKYNSNIRFIHNLGINITVKCISQKILVQALQIKLFVNYFMNEIFVYEIYMLINIYIFSKTTYSKHTYKNVVNNKILVKLHIRNISYFSKI